MIYATLMTVHVLSIIVWIGGMVFAHFFLHVSQLARFSAILSAVLVHGMLRWARAPERSLPQGNKSGNK
jgi:uncharacterized membrane protein